MSDFIKPAPVKGVTRRSNLSASARYWGGRTRIGLGPECELSSPPTARKNWGRTTRQGLGPAIGEPQPCGRIPSTEACAVPVGLFSKPSAVAFAQPITPMDALWLSFPWWWASVILAATLAFSVGAGLALLVGH